MIKHLTRLVAAVASGLVVASAPLHAAADRQPVACTGIDLVAKVQKDNPKDFEKLQRLAAAVPNGDALLWKIEKPGLPASYLFGTIHSTADAAVAIARSLAPYIRQTKTVATELGDISTAVAGLKLGFRALMSKVRSASLISSPGDRTRVEDLLRSRNLDPTAALRMPPWVLMTMTSFPLCEIDRLKREMPVVDNTIERLGKASGAKLVGLETIDEQADALESVDPKLAIHMVEFLASNKSLGDDAFATMTALYLAHRPGTMLPMMDATVALSPDDKKANDAFMVTIVEKRNRTMVDRALPLLDKGDAFIAVGALHLIGSKGLVALIRERGFTVTKVW